MEMKPAIELFDNCVVGCDWECKHSVIWHNMTNVVEQWLKGGGRYKKNSLAILLFSNKNSVIKMSP